MQHDFETMHGLGNDLVLFGARTAAPTLDGAAIRALADRRTGIGFDQLVLLGPSEVAAIRMEIRNADGSAPETCGNALRCVGLLLGGDLTVETDGGVVRVRAIDDRVRVELHAPRIASLEVTALASDAARSIAKLPRSTPTVPPLRVDVVNPYAVLFIDDLRSVDVERIGRAVERDPLFPDRTNVAFAQVLDAERIELRMWERGAGATRACGSGACATAVAAIHAGLVGDVALVRQPGGRTEVTWSAGGGVVMTGPATHVFSGRIDLP